MSEANQFVYKTRVESRLKAAQDVEEFKNVGERFIRDLGFSHFTFADLLGDNCFEITLSTLMSDVFDKYQDLNLGQYDFMTECCVSNSGLFFQSSIYEHVFASPYESVRIIKNKQIHKLLSSHDIHDSLAVALHSSNGHKDVTGMEVYCRGLSSDAFRSRVHEKSTELKLLAKLFYKFGFQRFSKKARCRNKNPFDFGSVITKKELEILQHYPKCDYSAEKVAEKLCRSKYTIHKHTENIRKKLEVHSTYEAVIMGAKAGMIQL